MFTKVSFNQFYKDFMKCFYYMEVKDWDDSCGEPNAMQQEAINAYNNIVIPTRATIASAGYDFAVPAPVDLRKGGTVTIPTGIRWTAEHWNQVLLCVPRSGYGFRNGLRLVNTVGVIDADYYCSDNEGHIMAKIAVDEDLLLKAGDRFMQGIIVNFEKTMNDSFTGNPVLRNGGFGSTDVEKTDTDRTC